MVWIIFAIISGLAAFQFHQAYQFDKLGMSLDCVFRVIAGSVLFVLALVFAAGVLLG